MRTWPLIETQYFPATGFFYIAANAGGLSVEACENYQKGSLRNRCIINGPGLVQHLSVPLIKGKHQQMPIRDVRISYKENWPVQHWRTLKTAYGSAPYFIHYEDEIRSLILERPVYLWDLNWQIAHKMNKLLGLNTELEVTQKYVAKPANGPLDLRSAIGPRKDHTIPVAAISDRISPYNALFQERNFPTALISSLELLFYAGPESPAVLSDPQFRKLSGHFIPL